MTHRRSKVLDGYNSPLDELVCIDATNLRIQSVLPAGCVSALGSSESINHAYSRGGEISKFGGQIALQCCSLCWRDVGHWTSMYFTAHRAWSCYVRLTFISHSRHLLKRLLDMLKGTLILSSAAGMKRQLKKPLRSFHELLHLSTNFYNATLHVWRMSLPPASV